MAVEPSSNPALGPDGNGAAPRRSWRTRNQQQNTLERVLGTPALFATAYGDVGSSIYYALGLTASFALGLTPLVFVIAGIFFVATAITYAEGTVRYPEAGGSSSFSRHAFNEVVSFGAGWAQMLNYVVTISISAFFVPHYLSVFWGPLRQNPWDIVGGAVVIVLLVSLNVFGVREAVRLNVVLAVIDFSTQVLLVALGAALIFNPHILIAGIHLGVAPAWSQFFLAIPIGMIAYTGMETISNLAEETRDPPRDVPLAYKYVAGAVFAIYLTLPSIALMALPVHRVVGGGYDTLLGQNPPHGYANDPVLGIVNNIGLHGFALHGAALLRRRPGRHDPDHRRQRGRDRLLADHLLDVEPPPASGAAAAAAPALQDPVPLADLLLGAALDPDPAAGQDRLPRDDVQLRRDALVRDRERVDHRAPLPLPRHRAPGQGPAEPERSGRSTGRSSRSSASSAPRRRGSWSSCRGR